MKRKNMAAMVTSIALVGVVAVGGTLALLSSTSNTVKNTFTVGADYPASALKVREHDATQDASGNWNKASNWKRNSGDTDYDGMQYTDLVGDATVDKDPQFVLASGSPKSWVTCYIDGLTELTNYVTVSEVIGADEVGGEVKGIKGDWYRYDPTAGDTFAQQYIKVESAEDIEDNSWYIFSEKVTGVGIGIDDESITDPIFTKLKVNKDVAKNNANADVGDKLTDGGIEVKGVAVQVVNDSLTNEEAWDAVMAAAKEAVKQG